MDYFRPPTYPRQPETYSSWDYLGGLVLVIALIVTLAMLAVAQLVPSWRAKTRGSPHG